jgi:DNA invertase Pin-like site-specific DNA recombinase
MIYGYARVSTDGEGIEAQVRQVTKAGCKKLFREVASGAKSDRAQFRRVIAALGEDDVSIVMRLDRLARSTRDLLNTIGAIADRKASFRSLADVWADTTTTHGPLILTVLGGLAEFDREPMPARTSEGRECAKVRDVKLGRKPRLTAHQKIETIGRRERGDLVRELAHSDTVKHSTISRLALSQAMHG